MKPAPTANERTSRVVLLGNASQSVGASWAQEWFADLEREGRTVSGGWPGTMSEARSRVRRHVDALLLRRSLPPITDEELKEATRSTYDCAKAAWFGSRVNDPGTP